MAILGDASRLFVSSRFVQLEVMPKAVHFGHIPEQEFFQTYFDAVTYWAEPGDIIESAYREACAAGLSAMDALHVAAAIAVGADELVTAERAKPIVTRVQSIRVVPVRP